MQNHIRFFYLELQKAEQQSRHFARSSKDTSLPYRPRGIHNHRSDRSGWTRVETQTRCTARYFRLSLLADVYYLFAASNPFDIPRRRINKSADHRGRFLAKALILIIPFTRLPNRYRSPTLFE